MFFWTSIIEVVYKAVTYVATNCFLYTLQIANSSSPMLEWKTAPSSSAMMAFVACVDTHVQRSCRSRVPAVFCMDHILDDQLWHRWPKLCWALKKERWRSPCIGKMVSIITAIMCMILRVS